MPPSLPERPKAVGCLAGLFISPDRKALRHCTESFESAKKRFRYGNDRRDPLVAIEAWSEGLVHCYHAIEWSVKARRPDLYDGSKAVFLDTYGQVEEHGKRLLEEYHEDRLRTLHRYKDRSAQERSANKTLEDLLRLNDDFLPEDAAQQYQLMLDHWQAQFARLRS